MNLDVSVLYMELSAEILAPSEQLTHAKSVIFSVSLRQVLELHVLFLYTFCYFYLVK